MPVLNFVSFYSVPPPFPRGEKRKTVPLCRPDRGNPPLPSFSRVLIEGLEGGEGGSFKLRALKRRASNFVPRFDRNRLRVNELYSKIVRRLYRIGPKKGSCPTNALQGLLPSSPSSAFSMLSLSSLLLLLPTLVPWASSRAFTEILAPRCLGRALRIFEKVSLEKAVRERERKKDIRFLLFSFFFFG